LGNFSIEVLGNFSIEKDELGPAPDRTQWLCDDRPACQSHANFISAPAHNQPSSRFLQRGPLTPFTLLFAQGWRVVRVGFSSSAAVRLVKLFWQFCLSEVSQ
jgi:hypothetical protein